MDLILWRHAQAEDHALGLADQDRRLTERGILQAQKMGIWLDKRLPKLTRIIVSPAVRTQQTAHFLGRKFETDPILACGARPEELLLAANWPEYEEAVLIVGHQPTLGQLASLLLTRKQAEWSIKKGAVWWFTHRVHDGHTQTQLKAVMNAKMI